MDLDTGDLERLLRSEGKMDRETETLVAIELYVGDDYGGMRIPTCAACWLRDATPGTSRT